MEWHLLGCANGGAVLVRGTDVREHPQSHLQILPLEEARLMMASQDLLAALKALVSRIEERGCVMREGVAGQAYSVAIDDYGTNWVDEFVAAEAAIAKAEGR